MNENNSIEAKKPQVSVVVPVYKVENYIVKTLESIVNQTYSNIELILVDDGTPDNSVSVAESYLSDKKIFWRFIHQSNSGLPTARNNGIKAARGEWVICPDSDDYIAPQTIERMVQVAEKLHVRCVFCGFKNVDEAHIAAPIEKEGEVIQLEVNKLHREFLERKIIPLVPGMLLKRSVYEKVEFDRDCPHDEDIHFMWRLFYEIDDIAYIDADYYNYLIRGTSMSFTLKPEAYLKTSQRYDEMTTALKAKYPNDKIVPLIWPKYRLGGLHVLAKANDYNTFRETVVKDGYRRDMSKLVFQRDAKLSLYALIYCLNLRLFYKISK